MRQYARNKYQWETSCPDKDTAITFRASTFSAPWSFNDLFCVGAINFFVAAYATPLSAAVITLLAIGRG